MLCHAINTRSRRSSTIHAEADMCATAFSRVKMSGWVRIARNTASRSRASCSLKGENARSASVSSIHALLPRRPKAKSAGPAQAISPSRRIFEISAESALRSTER